MLVVAGRASPLARLAYTLVLASEIYTTAISSLYGLIPAWPRPAGFWFKP